MCFEKLLSKLSDIYGLTMTAGQYVLVGSTVRSYLSRLHGKGEVSFIISDNSMLRYGN